MIMEKPCKACGKMFSKPQSVSVANWPARMYCSKKCQYDAMRGRPNSKLGDVHRGRAQAPEFRAKRVESIKRTYDEGTVKHARANLGLRGTETSQWKGDAIQYGAAHRRLYAQRGRPRECAFCGTHAGRLEWALSHEAALVKIQTGGRYDGRRYSPRPDDYIAACRACHRQYDGRTRDQLTGRYL